MEEEKYQLVYYVRENGKVPYRDWFESLKDIKAQAAVVARLARLRSGNFGACESVGRGLSELKIDYGPGYRVYFGVAGKQVVLLISGGDKSTQHQDIQKAKTYWTDYHIRSNR